MNLAMGFAWSHFCSRYRQLFGYEVPDWVCTIEMSGKLGIVRTACAIGMPLAQSVLVRNEAIDPRSPWG